MTILPGDDDNRTTLVHELVDAAARDLKAYRNADDPNRRASGDAALRSIDAATRALQTVRVTLANELHGFDRAAEPAAEVDRPRDTGRKGWPGGWPGNSGPGW